MIQKLRSVFFAIALVAAAQDLASAAIIDLAHPTITPIQATNIGSGDRSVILDADLTFSISSVGIRIDPLQGGATGLQVSIYNVLLSGGVGSRGSLLANASTGIADVGMAFYDIGINFSFVGGNRYEIAFDTVPPAQFGFGSNNMEFYNFDFPSPSYSVGGLVTVLDGGAFSGTYSNTVMPHVRFDGISSNEVPEPASLALFGLGAIGALGAARRRRLA